MTPAAISFGPFRLDSRSGRLTRGTEPVALRPKTWSVLSYLAQRPGVLVSKNELLDAVWGDVTVTEAVLSKSIGELRVALDDSPKTPRVIETVPRRGFRFIAPMDDGGAPSIAEPASLVTLPRSMSFVGRTAELRQLASSIEKAHTGVRQVVFVTGPAGIGKTALVGALLDSPAVREATAPLWVARGVCIDQHGPREAYMPIIQALEGLARHRDAGRLTRLLRQVAPTWLAQLPWLIGDDEHELRQSLQVVRPERMLREFASLVEALATDVTLVLVLEDLHWSDPSTVDLLSLLALRDEPARLMVIGTFRCADAIAREHPLMSTMRLLSVHRRCTELPLSDLAEEEVRQYLRARFPGNDFAPALARRIYRHTDGNPLFVIGVVDHMRARGHILETDPGWALRAPVDAIDLGVPDDVRLLIEDDLDGLSPADRAMLQAASVAGEDFTALVVAAALGSDVTDVEARCEVFARAQRLLRLAGHVEWPDRSVARRYAFAHELYRQAVYAQITEGQCMRFHQRIGQALEAAYGARHLEIAPQLATHFGRSRDDARTLRYLAAAAERARLRFANREAMEYLETALALLGRLPEDAERCRRELELRIALGAALVDVFGYASEQVRENYERAATLCSAVGSAEQRCGILYARWYVHAVRAERDDAIAIATELDDASRRLGSPHERVVAASVLVRTAIYDGRFTEGQDVMRRRLARAPIPSGTAWPAFGPEPVIVAATHSAVALWFLGYLDRARTTARASLQQAREFGHLFTLSAVLVEAALVELLCRSAESGAQLADEAMSLSAEYGFAFWNAMAILMRGWALVQQDRTSEGNAAIAAALSAMKATGTRFMAAFAYAFLAEGHWRAGTLDEGLAAVDIGLGLAESTLDRAYAPELWRLKGELLHKRSNLEGSRRAQLAKAARAPSRDRTEAETCFRRALDLAGAAKAKSLELRAATSLARLWQADGRATEAGTLLARTCRWFGASVDSADLLEARGMLRAVARD